MSNFPDNDWSTVFFRDRRLLLLAICLIVAAGLAALLVLPRMEDPVLTQRAGIINTIYPGASAERVEALVTEKIETRLQEIEQIKEMESISSDGISTITIELKDSVGPDSAANVWSRLRSKLADAEPFLPPDALEPEFDRLNISAYALIVALRWDSSSDVNFGILRRYAKELDNRLRKVSGTKEVDIFGDPEEEIVVSLRPDELSRRSLSVSDVAQQLRASDAKVTAGLRRGESSDVSMEIGNEFDSLARIRTTPIQFSAASQSVSLGDIANVRRAIRSPMRTITTVDGESAICVAALVLPEKRLDTWFADVSEVLTDFESELPAGIAQSIRFEQNEYVQDRLRTLCRNLLLGASAVVLVIGLMMGWRSAVVVGAALPLASLTVLAGLNWLGIPLHQMSITGLIIALGLLIDNAIVIVDEVGQKTRNGTPPGEAVAQSVRHLAIPLFGSTLTTALSFAPIALMNGPAGEFVGSIAISVLLAIFSSFFLAMTITPALAGIFQPRSDSEDAGRKWWHRGVSNSALSSWYMVLLRALYKRPVVGIAASLVVPIVGFAMGSTLTEQFFPPADRDQINIQMELPAMSSIAKTQRIAEEARLLLMQNEKIQNVDWYLGESAPPFFYNMLPNRSGLSQYGQAMIQLTDAHGVEPLIHQLQDQLDTRFPSARFLVRQLEQGPPFEAPIEVRISGPSLDTLRDLGNSVRRVLASTPDVVHATMDLSEALPTFSLDVDEEKARLAGVTQLEIASQLDAALEGAVGGLVLEDTESLPVRVRAGDDVRSDLDQIASIEVMTVSGPDGRRAVPLTNLAEVKLVPKVPSVRRIGNQRINEVRGYIKAGALPADILAKFKARLEQANLDIPNGYQLKFDGEASKRDDAVGNLMSSVGVLMVLMVATLVLSFSSYRMAAIIGAVALLAVGLSLGAVAGFGYPFGFMAIIGTMGLIGVAINDTIVVLAAIREDKLASEGEATAMARVVHRSTRHVLATTLTTIAGFTPLILEGGTFWPPLATAIAGGVSGATILALIFGPSCYRLLMCPNCQNPEEIPQEPRAAVQQTELRTVNC